MKVKSEMYVEGMRCLGAGHLRIVLRHVLPNIRTNVILQFTTRVGRVVLSVAGLSYLGLGIEPPTPTGGRWSAAPPAGTSAAPPICCGRRASVLSC